MNWLWFFVFTLSHTRSSVAKVWFQDMFCFRFQNGNAAKQQQHSDLRFWIRSLRIPISHWQRLSETQPTNKLFHFKSLRALISNQRFFWAAAVRAPRLWRSSKRRWSRERRNPNWLLANAMRKTWVQSKPTETNKQQKPAKPNKIHFETKNALTRQCRGNFEVALSIRTGLLQ